MTDPSFVPDENSRAWPMSVDPSTVDTRPTVTSEPYVGIRAQTVTPTTNPHDGNGAGHDTEGRQ